MTYTPADYLILGLGVVLVVLVSALIYRSWKASRIPPDEVERRRRAELVAGGKMADALLTEMRGNFVIYSYDVRGVEYTASQDISFIKDRLPADASGMGPAAVKYDPRNPANSIVVAEDWSGLRM